ncbi:hypothetical protein Ddc_22174 [Ditylenchus destructor]|nr:hypothetical protein Ddc_22174 [Ditylenchus destructor]
MPFSDSSTLYRSAQPSVAGRSPLLLTWLTALWTAVLGNWPLWQRMWGNAGLRRHLGQGLHRRLRRHRADGAGRRLQPAGVACGGQAAADADAADHRAAGLFHRQLRRGHRQRHGDQRAADRCARDPRSDGLGLAGACRRHRADPVDLDLAATAERHALVQASGLEPGQRGGGAGAGRRTGGDAHRGPRLHAAQQQDADEDGQPDQRHLGQHGAAGAEAQEAQGAARGRGRRCAPAAARGRREAAAGAAGRRRDRALGQLPVERIRPADKSGALPEASAELPRGRILRDLDRGFAAVHVLAAGPRGLRRPSRQSGDAAGRAAARRPGGAVAGQPVRLQGPVRQGPECASHQPGAPGSSDSAGLCRADGECLDEVMLHDLDARIAGLDPQRVAKGVVLVLHQMGSHGPAYYLRTPEERKPFQPSAAAAPCNNARWIRSAMPTTTRSPTRTMCSRARSTGWARRNRSLIPACSTSRITGNRWARTISSCMECLTPSRPRSKTRAADPVVPGPDAQSQHLDAACLAQRRDTPMSHDGLYHTC